ncbi:hypothetical protein GUJ93_ZPchr0005g16250 [Zizania palustris]|uniref:Uncharacterized protein n=1 Tax=Zizania palustris TaxID=103762 RepID=A0A8J5S4L3_ZIZPA|nr:hypothetical protein GUJ93_ZPchr0005g16250 [Zizania palustris]
MDLPYLWSLTFSDWSRKCRPDNICFDCSFFFCDHCCPGHREDHHPESRLLHFRRSARFGSIYGYPAVQLLNLPADSIWRDIEMVRMPHTHLAGYIPDGANWILLKPMLTLPPDPIPGLSCLNCHRRIWTEGARYCSAYCKLVQVQQGEERDLMLAFVLVDYDQGLPRDRFCCLCFAPFSSAFCADHMTIHHPGQNVAGYPGQIVEIVHINGWAAVAPSMLVPRHVLAGVQFGSIHGYPAVLLLNPPAVTVSLWRDIERVRMPHTHPLSPDGGNWILLKPIITLPPGPVPNLSCLNCQRRIWSEGARYCSAFCKLYVPLQQPLVTFVQLHLTALGMFISHLIQVQQGEGLDVMLAFILADYNLQPAVRDRFCCLCFASFSSAICAQHMTLHHPALNITGCPGQTVEIVHINGWAAVAPSMLVTGQVLDGVQVLNAADGALLTLSRRQLQLLLLLLLHCGHFATVAMMPFQTTHCIVLCAARLM